MTGLSATDSTGENAMAHFQCNPGEGGDPDKLRSLLPPGQTETSLRNCIQMCWMSLPADRRSIDEVEKEVRRIVDRIFQNIREDDQARSA
jgi:hypothetical protein